MEVSNKILELRKKANLTQKELADLVGTDLQHISRWERGIIKNIPSDMLKKLAKAFNVPVTYIMGFGPEKSKRFDASNEFESPTGLVSVYGSIAAGKPTFCDEQIEGKIWTNLSNPDSLIGLRINGDSMNLANLPDGAIAIVRTQSVVDNGDIAVVRVGDDEATVKRFYRDGDIVTLKPQSSNPDHKPLVYNLRMTNLNVIGRVVAIEILM